MTVFTRIPRKIPVCERELETVMLARLGLSPHFILCNVEIPNSFTHGVLGISCST